MISSTPLRKSCNRRLNDTLPCTPVEEVTANDDTERRKRRSIYDVERRLINISESNLSTPADIDQMKNHIKMSQKLFMENKITVRNAWDIKVIEYIHHYVSSTKIGSEELVVAAMTLDVCVKVHGCRIEYIGQEINKLITTHASLAAKDKESNEGEDEIQDDETTTRNQKNKRKRKRITATIAKDSSSLLSDISKVPSTHFTGSIDINANSFENMFTRKIPMDHDCYKFNLICNEENGFASYDATIKKNPLQVTIAVPNIQCFNICPEFRTFNVDEIDPDSNNSIASIMTNDHPSRTNSLIANEVAYDDDGVPIPELDGSTHDIFADDANGIDDIIDDENHVIEQTAPRRVEMITSFCPAERPTPRSNSTRSTLSQSFLETIWVGPSHWKNKLIRQSAPRFSGKSDEKNSQLKTKRKASVQKKNDDINLDAPIDIDMKSICNTKKIQYNIKKLTLPPNILTIIPECDKLILRDMYPAKECHVHRNEPDFEHSPYDYNNADDSQYCSQVELPDINHDVEDQEDIQNDIVQENATGGKSQGDFNLTNNLVDLPDMVTQTYIPYAVRAKKVNMKKMKTALLSCLCKDIKYSDTQEPDIGKIEPTSFSTIYKKVPAKLPRKIRSEISVPIAFFSLLHLTNEHNLTLSKSEIANDIIISKD